MRARPMFFWGIVFCSVANAEPAVDRTAVHTFQPALPAHGKVVEGSCWTGSLAVARSGAWRCTVGNEIHDPCFTTSVGPGELVCDADPVSGESGFTLKLTQPLPDAGNTAKKGSPWVVQLANGAVCRPYTGTMPITDQGAISFYCVLSDDPEAAAGSCQTGLLADSVKEGTVWTANEVTFCRDSQSETGAKAKKSARVPIEAVWQ